MEINVSAKMYLKRKSDGMMVGTGYMVAMVL